MAGVGSESGSSIADLGAPLAGTGDITGFSILEADLGRHSTSCSPTTHTATCQRRRSTSTISYRSRGCDRSQFGSPVGSSTRPFEAVLVAPLGSASKPQRRESRERC